MINLLTSSGCFTCSLYFICWSIASGLATVFVEYNLKTGYFKRRMATALDTDPNYYWQKVQVRLYKDRARKILLSDKTTKGTRNLIMT